MLSNFEQILQEVQKTRKPIKTTPYVALQHLGVTRRGLRVNEAVNRLLEKYDAICEPEYASAYFYGQIEIKPKPKVPAGKTTKGADEDIDPTPRLSLLKAANLNTTKDGIEYNGLISVKRDTTLQEAITLMILHDFSQLPVLSGSRSVDGMISWRSIGKALGLGKKCCSVSECLEEAAILNYDVPLFDAVKVILSKEVVLVRQKDTRITGIVTATDIGEQFISLAEPFLIIEQIENHIRKMMDGKFSIEEIHSSIDPNDSTRDIKSLSDLSFGEYLRIIQNEDKFRKLAINLDRSTIIKQLEDVRQIRNDVMHFDPDGISPDEIEILRQTVRFFHSLSTTFRQN